MIFRSPSHLTGFFEINLDKDPLRAGSRGCGICIEKGVLSEVLKFPRNEIEIDGSPADAETTRWVVEKLAPFPVKVRSWPEIPVGCGLGASAAGALSVAFAINELFSLGKSRLELFSIAHSAEVIKRTGLGTVAGIYHGGITVRKEPGIYGIENVVKVKVKTQQQVSWITLGGIKTKDILNDERKRKEINLAGRKALKEMLRNPTIENFMKLSRRFAYETELASEKAKDIIEAVEAENGLASMAMLGDTVFALGGGEVLSRFGKVGKSRIRK
jgi:pantoate kinase